MQAHKTVQKPSLGASAHHAPPAGLDLARGKPKGLLCFAPRFTSGRESEKLASEREHPADYSPISHFTFPLHWSHLPLTTSTSSFITEPHSITSLISHYILFTSLFFRVYHIPHLSPNPSAYSDLPFPVCFLPLTVISRSHCPPWERHSADLWFALQMTSPPTRTTRSGAGSRTTGESSHWT